MIKENFKVTSQEDGKEYWVCRSSAVCVVIYCYSKNPGITPCFLVHKRGTGCPDFVGYMSCNCGYVSFGEKVINSAVREVYEEIGLKLHPDQLIYLGYNDPIDTENQTITHRFLVKLDIKDVRDRIFSGEININSFSRGGEKNEVKEISMLRGSDINDPKYRWAFEHDKLMKEILNNNVYRD